MPLCDLRSVVYARLLGRELVGVRVDISRVKPSCVVCFVVARARLRRRSGSGLEPPI